MAIVETCKPTRTKKRKGTDTTDTKERRRLSLKRPTDRAPLGEITVAHQEDVQAAIERARTAQPAWAALSPKERARIVHKAIDVLLRRQEEVVRTIRDETGKTRADALAIEVLSSCDFINFWCAKAARSLADEKKRLHGYLRPLKKLVVQYKPLGVVGVITPWNGPFVLSMNPCVQALLAGNAVILKPSEVSPHSGGWAVDILQEAGVPKDVIQCLQGDGETGAALVNGGVDKIAFTGSVPTGRRIAVACAEQLIPCTLELGGKDPMIVCEDANLERAASGAAFLAFFNTGQVCLGVERVYVVDSVADEFLALLEPKVREVRYGAGEDAEVGAIFNDRQMDIIERHVRDARDKGATVLVGGEAELETGLFYRPTLLTDVNHDMAVMQEETFGPIVAVMRVKDEEEAIRMANDSRYGLSASVFSTNQDRVQRIARRLDAGSVLQNDAAVVYGIPEAPFGGRKHSGLGQMHGANALRGFTFPTPVILDRWGLDKEDIWFPFTERTIKTLETTIKVAFDTPLRHLMS